jgi:hypothetical protein
MLRVKPPIPPRSSSIKLDEIEIDGDLFLVVMGIFNNNINNNNRPQNVTSKDRVTAKKFRVVA